MDAPLYLPSQRYIEPERVPALMTTHTSSFADFLSHPEAKSILESEIPGFERLISNPKLKPHMGNMAPRTMVQFGAFKPEALDRVDAKLKAAGIVAGRSQ